MSSQPGQSNNDTIQMHHILRKERGALFPQIVLTFAMSLGTISLGHIINWGEAALEHMDDLEYDVKNSDHDYAWLLVSAPLGISVGTLIWGFLTTRMGPKKTLIYQTPLMMISWFLMAYFKTYKIYWIGHFMAAFCSASYLFAGEVLLVECVHRRNIKIFFAFFRSSIILGVLSMNIFATFFKNIWLCIICANFNMICFALTITLPDSPRYLILKNEVEAENSLKYYLGKNSVGSELNVLRQHVYLLHVKSYTNSQMLTSKVVLKAVLIIMLVHFFTTCTGYYAFILDSVRIFQASTGITPYANNILFGLVLYVTTFIGYFVHLYGNFGVKKPMMISMFFCSLLLCTMGIMDFLSAETNYKLMHGTMLIILSIFSLSYNVGMNICPESTLYAYIPYQIYDFLKKVMMVVEWILICVVTRVYMECKSHLGFYGTVWILTGLTIIGFIFLTIFIVDVKDKSLTNIQMELGGNPVGTRGSTRQRLANPFQTIEEAYYLQNLIAADLNRNKKSLSSNFDET